MHVSVFDARKRDYRSTLHVLKEWQLAYGQPTDSGKEERGKSNKVKILKHQLFLAVSGCDGQGITVGKAKQHQF